jgi:hypothetical protein
MQVLNNFSYLSLRGEKLEKAKRAVGQSGEAVSGQRLSRHYAWVLYKMKDVGAKAALEKRWKAQRMRR